MSALLLGVSPEAAGSIFASVVAAATGVGAYRSNRRTKRNAEVADEAKATAELNRAEVEAWTSLIDTLSKQYASSAAEAGELRARLAKGNRKFETITEALRVAHERCAVLEERVKLLRAEVARLGGDVDEINRIGKRGPVGEKGPPGEPG